MSARMPAPSRTQKALLDAMKAGVRIHYMPYRGMLNPNAYYFRADTWKRVTGAARGLIKLKLAKNVQRDSGDFLELTKSANSDAI